MTHFITCDLETKPLQGVPRGWLSYLHDIPPSHLHGLVPFIAMTAADVDVDVDEDAAIVAFRVVVSTPPVDLLREEGKEIWLRAALIKEDIPSESSL